MSSEVLVAIVTVIGGGGFITVLAQAWRTHKDGTAARQRELTGDIRDRADRAEHNELQREVRERYWQEQCMAARRIAAEAGAAGKLSPLAPPPWQDWKKS